MNWRAPGDHGAAGGAVESLFSATAVRDRCATLYQAGLADQLTHLRINGSRWDQVLRRNADQVRASFPTGPIPIHGRLNHLRAPTWDLASPLLQRSGPALIDAVAISVLIDAGAGSDWTFEDPLAGRIGRSEGLAIAAYRALESGLFSATATPFETDADALRELDQGDLSAAMQVRPDNPIVGLPGRAALLRGLGEVIHGGGQTRLCDLLCHDLFGTDWDTLGRTGTARTVTADHLLQWILDRLGPLWPGRIERAGLNLGDTWEHPLAGGEGETSGLVPFHKLSQWLTYSLIEPLRHLGIEVSDTDQLTGLAEYRNGGMLVQLGLIELREGLPTAPVAPEDRLVVEWRAVTVAALDILATRITPYLPERPDIRMGELLEAATWPLGRQLARHARADGAPPIRIQSDGTVF